MRLGQQRVRFAQAVEEAPALRFRAVHRSAGVQQFRCAAGADDARQDVARAHVGAGETDAHEQECDPAGRRAEAQIGRHRDDRAGAGADAIHCGHDHLRAGAHRLHQVAGHVREVEQTLHVARFLHANQTAR